MTKKRRRPAPKRPGHSPATLTWTTRPAAGAAVSVPCGAFAARSGSFGRLGSVDPMLAGGVGVRSCRNGFASLLELRPVTHTPDSSGHGNHEQDNCDDHERRHRETQESGSYLIRIQPWPQPFVPGTRGRRRGQGVQACGCHRDLHCIVLCPARYVGARRRPSCVIRPGLEP